jgi:hypothetical protein
MRPNDLLNSEIVSMGSFPALNSRIPSAIIAWHCKDNLLIKSFDFLALAFAMISSRNDIRRSLRFLNLTYFLSGNICPNWKMFVAKFSYRDKSFRPFLRCLQNSAISRASALAWVIFTDGHNLCAAALLTFLSPFVRHRMCFCQT